MQTPAWVALHNFRKTSKAKLRAVGEVYGKLEVWQLLKHFDRAM